MAKGSNCRQCNAPMFALKEDYQPHGTWVVYQCTNGKCKFEEKKFEKK